MVREIEMKARLHRPQEALSRIQELCTLVGEHFKEDLYFRPPGEGENIRLRREGDRWICTRKSQSLRDGLEVNEEIEFFLSDGPAMRVLLEDLGCRLFLEKTKEGRTYTWNDLTVEVSQVPPLGLFVEVECLLSSYHAGDEVPVEKKIRGFLAEIGIQDEEIEKKTYTEMLLDAGEGREP